MKGQCQGFCQMDKVLRNLILLSDVTELATKLASTLALGEVKRDDLMEKLSPVFKLIPVF